MKHIKTRINHKTKAGKAAQKIGGVSVSQLQNALKGDQTVLKKLGSIYREGKMAEALMPAIMETMKTKIKNEKDWNTFLADYVSDGSKAEIDIQKAQNKASLSNAKYVHGMKELTEETKATWELEKGRHKFAIDYNRAKLFAELVFQEVEGKVKVEGQGTRLKQKQIDEEFDYQLKASEHLLEYGDDADLGLIQKRDYAAKVNSPWAVIKRARNALGI